jgi:hypothetical protein
MIPRLVLRVLWEVQDIVILWICFSESRFNDCCFRWHSIIKPPDFNLITFFRWCTTDNNITLCYRKMHQKLCRRIEKCYQIEIWRFDDWVPTKATIIKPAFTKANSQYNYILHLLNDIMKVLSFTSWPFLFVINNLTWITHWDASYLQISSSDRLSKSLSL